MHSTHAMTLGAAQDDVLNFKIIMQFQCHNKNMHTYFHYVPQIEYSIALPGTYELDTPLFRKRIKRHSIIETKMILIT